MEKRGNQGTWKRLRRDGDETRNYFTTMLETGSKRKGMTPSTEVQEEIETGKRSKKEQEVAFMGHLMVRHLGSAEVAVQPRRHP